MTSCGRSRWAALAVLALAAAVWLGAAVGPLQAQGVPQRVVVCSAPTAPAGVESQIVTGTLSSSVKILSEVPTSDWTYGCSATSAGMIFGYYDRTGYSNIYTGPCNGGVAPLADLGNQCSLIATRSGFDGRVTPGHVDDYWGSTGQDPWVGQRTEHAWGDCTADFMGTNQWKWDFNKTGATDSNIDGGTTYFYDDSGSRLYDYVPPAEDGLPQTELCHGMRLFAESRGYTVTENYTQPIAERIAGGFTFADYMAEIDAGYPVMIQLTSHSVVGVGYDAATRTVYLHDTWGDYTATMTWGGDYSGLEEQAVTVIHITPEPATALMLALGGAFVFLKRRRR